MSDDEGDRLLIDDHDMSGTIGLIEDGNIGPMKSSAILKDKKEDAITGAAPVQVFPAQILTSTTDSKEVISTIDEGKQLDTDVLMRPDESREEGEIVDDMEPISVPSIISSLQSKQISPNHRTQPTANSGHSSLSIDITGDKAASLAIKKFPSSKKSSVEEKASVNGSHHIGSQQKHGSTHERKKTKEEPHEDRKRTSSVLRTNEPHSSKKAKKDEGTSVRTIGSHCDSEENLFDQAPGTQGLLNYTVVCKTDSNAIYISVRYKDDEYFGVLSDGQPMNFAYKKRSMMNGGPNRGRDGEEKESSSGKDKENGASTPSKNRNKDSAPGTPRDPKRTNRGSSAPVEKKRSVAGGVKNEEKDEEEGDSNDGASESGPYTILNEIPPKEEQHVCGVDGCGHRYSRGHELDYHQAHAHPSKRIVFDTRGSQTEAKPIFIDRGVDPVSGQKVDVEVQTEGQVGSIICGLSDSEQQKSIAMMMSKARRDTVDTIPATTSEDRHSAYSDISDDGAPAANREGPPNRPSSSIGRSGGGMGLSAPTNSAFTPTDAMPSALRAEETTPSVLQSGSGLSVSGSAPTLHATAFHPITDNAKARPSSVASNPSQTLTASPRPAIPIGTAGAANAFSNLPFMMMNAQFPMVATASSSSPVRQQASENAAAQHKIHELKAKALGASSSAEISQSLPGGSSMGQGNNKTAGNPRSIASPARSVAGQQMLGMMGGSGGQAPQAPQISQQLQHQQQQQQQQMMAAQHMAAQQFQQFMMMYGGRGTGFPTDPALAQQMAMHAAQMFGQGAPHMYPK